MTLKLVDDEPTTMTEDQARAYLMKLSTPALDALRARVPAMRTSELFGLMGNPEMLAQLAGLTDEDALKTGASQEIFMAGMIALCEEIDRRIPIPKLS